MHFARAFFFSLLLVITGFAVGASFGVNYGRVANDLPSPNHAVKLLQSIGATQVKIYDVNHDVLCAFANTSIQLVVGLGNEYLSEMSNTVKAQAWVEEKVSKYLPSTQIVFIAIGNEVLTLNDTTTKKSFLPAMQSVHAALVKLNLDKKIRVVSAQSLAVLGNSYPPSKGAFKPDMLPYVCSLLSFLNQTGSVFFLNAYPYFAYKASPNQISLNYVLFEKNEGILDVSNSRHYENMLFAQIDAVYSALAVLGFQNIEVVVSETGWPSKGDPDEIEANPESARKYNGNLINLINQKKTTPMKSSSSLNVYVFALFNENQKPGPSSERNYGLFKSDGSPAYSLMGITGSGPNFSNTPPAHSATPPHQFSILSSPPPSPGYMSISSKAIVDCRYHRVWLLILCGFAVGLGS